MKCALVLLGPIYIENTCLVPGGKVTRLLRWVNFFLHLLTKLEEPFTSETKSWLGLKGDLLSLVTLRQLFFTVHIPQVRIQFTTLQINKQAWKCLPALNVIQNVVFDGGEITYNYVVIFVVTCGIWQVKETSPSPFWQHVNSLTRQPGQLGRGDTIEAWPSAFVSSWLGQWGQLYSHIH